MLLPTPQKTWFLIVWIYNNLAIFVFNFLIIFHYYNWCLEVDRFLRFLRIRSGIFLRINSKGEVNKVNNMPILKLLDRSGWIAAHRSRTVLYSDHQFWGFCCTTQLKIWINNSLHFCWYDRYKMIPYCFIVLGP